MNQVSIIIQFIIAMGIFNVWILRYGKPTSWRGKTAQNMREEFEAYGLPGWSVGLVGFLKLFFAVLLIVGIWYPALVNPAAIGIAILMLGAIVMHIKVKDPLKKSLPAFIMLVLSLIVVMM